MKKHLLRISDLTKEEILAILDRAEELRQGSKPKQFPGTILGLLFFQPSTRTRFGFHAAIARLGGTAITLEQTKYQPGMIQPESFEDTLYSIATYCDAFVIRHSDCAFPSFASRTLSGVLVNAGNGTDEHPSQGLIDLFAIRHTLGRLDDLNVAILGDLRSSRAAHSLIAALGFFPPLKLHLLSPPGASLPTRYHPLGVSVRQYTAPHFPTADLDLVYVAGLPPQTPLASSDAETRRNFSIDSQRLAALPQNCIILSPLPRIDEIHPNVDNLPRAGYFLQSTVGHFVRQSLLETLFSATA